MSESTNGEPRRNLTEAWQETLTQKIINDLEEGVPTWVKPWRDGSGSGVAMPTNAFTGRSYTGANVLQLWLLALENGYRTHQWATYNQVQKAGARVRKGARAAQVIFVNFPEKPSDDDEETKKRPVYRVFWVFNLDQLEGLPAVYSQPDPLPEEGMEIFVASTRFTKDAGIKLQLGHDKAAYFPRGDYVVMPNRDAFTDDTAFAGTLFHEAIHWTGHPDRLVRRYGKKFGDNDYAIEEIVAELGSAFLCAQQGILPTTRTHSSYIAHWVRVLKENPRAIVSLASYASTAHGFLNREVEKTRMPQQDAA